MIFSLSFMLFLSVVADDIVSYIILMKIKSAHFKKEFDLHKA